MVLEMAEQRVDMRVGHSVLMWVDLMVALTDHQRAASLASWRAGKLVASSVH